MQASSPGGDSSYSWLVVCALGHVVGKGEWDSRTPPDGGVKTKGNTPDLILEHFIAFCFDVTAITPAWRSWNLTVMAIQHCYSQGYTKLGRNPAINYKDQLTVATLQSVGVTLILLQVL